MRTATGLFSAAAFVFVLVREARSWNCSTSLKLKPSLSLEKKGFAIEDLTYYDCPDKLIDVWPGTSDRVLSLRVFRGAAPISTHREVAKFARRNGAKVLVGTSVGCDHAADAEDWKGARSLLALLGPDHVLGLAVGNEVNLLHFQKMDPAFLAKCVDDMWSGYYKNFVTQRVQDMDSLPGFAGRNLPITAVLTPVDKGDPAYKFLQDMNTTLGHRFVYTFNTYPYFDSTLSSQNCAAATACATCFVKGCGTFKFLAQMRSLATEISGRNDSVLWMGEMGWSSPKADTLFTDMSKCPGFSSVSAFRAMYEGFLGWNLAEPAPGGLRPPDHIFYFSMRDGIQNQKKEHFGQVGNCGTSSCKLQDEHPPLPHHCPTKEVHGGWHGMAVAISFVLLCVVCCFMVCVKAGRPVFIRTNLVAAWVAKRLGHQPTVSGHVSLAQPLLNDR